MSNQIAPFEYNIFTTADGSPTMAFPGGEKMHSLHGALAESAYVYLPPVQRALVQQDKPQILSMGLGLGYNEWLAMAATLRHSQVSGQIAAFENSPTIGLHSFESVEPLRQQFCTWLEGDTTPSLVPVFREVLEMASSFLKVSAQEVFSLGQTLYRSQHWQLHGPLPTHNPAATKFHVLLYDAFSGQSDSHLWQEDFLRQFLQEYAADACELTTYAATGNLNRALKHEGFQVEKIKGFAVKRQSTRAIRTPMASVD